MPPRAQASNIRRAQSAGAKVRKRTYGRMPQSNWMQPMDRCLGVGLGLLTLFGQLHAHAQAAPPPATILIFDGSGSMWGKLENEKLTKLVQARDAIKAALGKVQSQSTQMGLLSYGHRRQADCGDVQVIVPLEAAAQPAFVDRIASPLEKLNPKGKGPLTAALKEAAKVLGKSGGSRSIVLVHDDPDNCQQDACAALNEIQQIAPGVMIHVVGLGLKPEDATRYQCLTKPTGGRHVNAQDGDQTTSGLAETIQLALQGERDTGDVPSVVVVSTQAPTTPPAKAPPIVDVAKDGPPALHLRALLAKGVTITNHRVRWTLWKEPRQEGAPPVAVAEGPDVILPVPEGNYRIRAEAGLLTAEGSIAANAQGHTLADTLFDGGEIRLKTPLPADATLVLAEKRATTTKPAAPNRRLTIWPHIQMALLVPPGAYSMLLEHGELRADRTVTVAGGQSQEVDAILPGGRVILDLALTAGPPSAGVNAADQAVVFTIAEDDPDGPRGRREIARSAAQTAEFVVPPGAYIVTASRGPMETRERITVLAGEAVRRSLPLVAARLVLGVRLGNAASSAGATGALDSFRLTRLDGANEKTLLIAGPVAIADVPPGRYRVEARRAASAIRVQQEIEVKAGEYKPVTLDYRAGAVRLDAILKPESAGQGVSWHILDAAGHLVWSSYEAAPSTLLSVGRYTVRMAVRGASREQTLDIRDGEITTLRMNQP
jgi:Ca-activated chloride channel homolog